MATMPVYNMTDLWNSGGTTYDAIKMNVTDSASAAASRLMTLQVGSTDKSYITKAGLGYFAGGLLLAAASALVVGHTANLAIGGNSNSAAVFGTTAATGGVSIGMFSATAGTGPHLDFYRSKDATLATATVVASGDALGIINAFGAQQTGTFSTQSPAAQIRFEVDGTVTSGASGDMPGRIVFATTADGGSAVTDRLILDSAGVLKPSTNDGVALGTTSLGFADLFGATGFTWNIANGNWLATHSSGIMTVTTGDLRVTTAGTNAASVVTLSGTQTLANKTFTDTVTLTSTDAGAGVAPDIILYRNSASPAVADLLGRILFRGKDSAANDQDYAQDYAYIEDHTSTSEDARRIFQVVYAGTMRDALSLRGYQSTWGNTTAVTYDHYLAGDAGIHTIGGGSDNTSIRLSLNGKTNANANEYGFVKYNGLGDDAYYIYQGGVHKFQNGNVTATGNVSSGAYSSSGASAGWTTGTAAVGTQSSSKTSTASQTHYQFVNPNGLVGSITTTASATAFNTSSDQRLKENFTDLDASSMIDAIRMYEFSWKADGTRGFGVKAQECFEVFPEAITVGVGVQGDEDYMPWSADYSKFVPLLLAEVKALRGRLASAEAALASIN